MNCLAEKLKESTSFMKDWTSKHSLSGSKAGKRAASVEDTDPQREGGKLRRPRSVEGVSAPPRGSQAS